MEYADKAIRLSPRDPFLPDLYWHKGFAYFLEQRDLQAMEWLHRVLAAWPEWPLPHALLAAALALNENEVEARESIKHYLSLKSAKNRTISTLTAQGALFSDSPFWLAHLKRVSEGLRRAGSSRSGR